tara:strand:- start:362 stop:514 length:153 start_codon:yes stop_codon:yes gene_type:complete
MWYFGHTPLQWKMTPPVENDPTVGITDPTSEISRQHPAVEIILDPTSEIS